MTQIDDLVFIGDLSDAQNPAGISAILNCASDMHFYYDALPIAKCGLHDGPGNEVAMYYAALFALAAFTRKKWRTLVCCHGGESRSVAVAIGYLHATKGGGWDHWRSEMHKARPLERQNPVPAMRMLFDLVDWLFVKSIIRGG